MPVRNMRKKGARNAPRRRMPRPTRTMPIAQQITRATPDGASFIGSAPSLRATMYNSVYTFDLIAQEVKRYVVNVGVSPIVDTINFQISDLPQITTFSALFDQYRIKHVVASFRSTATQVYWGNSSGDVPTITTAIDYNDNFAAAVPAKEFSTAVTLPMTTSFVRALTPRTAVPVYNGVTSAYMLGPLDAWLDITYPAIPHYSIVVNTGTTSIDNQFVYIVDVIYTIEFRAVV